MFGSPLYTPPSILVVSELSAVCATLCAIVSFVQIQHTVWPESISTVRSSNDIPPDPIPTTSSHPDVSTSGSSAKAEGDSEHREKSNKRAKIVLTGITPNWHFFKPNQLNS